MTQLTLDAAEGQRLKRDGMTRLKVAAGVFTCYQWSLAKWNGQGFDLTDVYGGER